MPSLSSLFWPKLSLNVNLDCFPNIKRIKNKKRFDKTPIDGFSKHYTNELIQIYDIFPARNYNHCEFSTWYLRTKKE